jgi:hypothetical protein
VAKGGYSIWAPNSPSLQDELYINDGKGRMLKVDNALPNVSSSSKSCVRPQDFDGDGDMDVFIGGRVIPGQYPVSPESFLLVNDGKGNFSKAKVPFDRLGMITDAAWYDFNADGRPDLLLCGEMMPLTIYINTPGGFENESDRYFPLHTEGFWSAVKVEDMDGDGEADIVACNVGRNVPFRVSSEQPATLAYADFDNNGSIDPVFNFYIKGRSYPYVSRDELNEQMVGMRKKFLSYESYADATIKEIFTQDELNKANELIATEQETVLLLRRQGVFSEKAALPIQAQFSYQKKVLVEDFNGDGIKDILLLGNQTFNRLKMGAIQGNRGTLLLGKGEGRFEYAGQLQSGLNISGDVKSSVIIRIQDKNVLLVGAGDQSLQWYSYEQRQ